jgi:hypothetical protein
VDMAAQEEAVAISAAAGISVAEEWAGEAPRPVRAGPLSAVHSPIAPALHMPRIRSLVSTLHSSIQPPRWSARTIIITHLTSYAANRAGATRFLLASDSARLTLGTIVPVPPSRPQTTEKIAARRT